MRGSRRGPWSEALHEVALPFGIPLGLFGFGGLLAGAMVVGGLAFGLAAMFPVKPVAPIAAAV